MQKPPKRGRPRKKTEELASAVLYLKLTPAQRAALDEAAERAGEPVSTWAKRLLLRAARRK